MGSYEVSEAEGVKRGTKVVIHLKGDAYDFAKDDKIKGLLQVSFLLITLFIFTFMHYVIMLKIVHFERVCCFGILEIIEKYSNFVGVPIYLNGKRVNVVEVRPS